VRRQRHTVEAVAQVYDKGRQYNDRKPGAAAKETRRNELRRAGEDEDGHRRGRAGAQAAVHRQRAEDDAKWDRADHERNRRPEAAPEFIAARITHSPVSNL
jgi:hypothetical protein